VLTKIISNQINFFFFFRLSKPKYKQRLNRRLKSWYWL